MTIIGEAYRVAWGDLVNMRENFIEVLLSTLIGPLLYLLAFGFGVGGIMDEPQDYVLYIVPGIVALNTLSSTFSSVSMKVLVQRLFYMSFDELLLCPLHISAIILGKAMQGVVRALVSCTVLLIVGLLLCPQLVISPWVFAVILAAGLMFSLLGLLAGLITDRTQNLTLFSSVAVIPMTFLCGTLFDPSTLPAVAAFIIDILPLSPVSSLMRGLMIPEYGIGLGSIAIIAVYIALLYGGCYYMIKNNKC